MGQPLTRISLRPRLTGLLRFFLVSRHLQIVGNIDKELLPVTGAIPQLIGFACTFRGESRLFDPAIHAPQRRICHRELGVDRNASLEVGHSGASATLPNTLPPPHPRFQRFEPPLTTLPTAHALPLDRCT